MIDIANAADNAANYLEQHGHHKGAAFGPNGSVCMVGAIGMANYKNTLEEKELLVKACKSYIGVKHLPPWNDAHQRKPEEVIQVLRDVATKHRSDEMRSGK